MVDFLIQLDRQIFELINSQWTHPWADLFFVEITNLHKTFWLRYIVVPAFCLGLIWKRKILGLVQLIFLSAVLGIADGVLGGLIKNFFMRARPAEAEAAAIVRSNYGGYSFTSNHASNIFCLALILTALFPKGRWFFLFYAFLVAYSRVYVGVHYPSDVIFGALWGSLWAWFCIKFILKPLQQRFKNV